MSERLKSWQMASPTTMGHSWLWTSHSGAQSLRGASDKSYHRQLGQRSQVRRAGGERTVPTCRGGDGVWRKVEHGGFGVRGRRGTSSGKGRPPALRRSAFLAWRKRWTRMLSVSCARAFATSLVTSHTDAWAGVDGSAPDLADLYREGSCLPRRPFE